MVELWVELHEVPPIFHHNSTTRKRLIITTITMQRWKGGITNNKKYFSGKRWEKVVTTQVGLPYSYYDETIAA